MIALRGRDARVQPAMNLFDGIASKLKESVSDLTKEVKVQHILVESESQAVEIRKKISKEGLETFGKYAQTYSTCGSAKKAPDAKLAQLRGLPGEMVFRKGQTDKAFETAAFEGKVGTVQGPVKTKFGYHLILVNERSEGLGGGEEGGSRADADASAQEEEESKQTESEATEMSKSASKKQLKAKKKRAK